MRKPTATVESSTGNSPGRHLYDHMINTSLATHMTSGRGVGIAETLYRDWTGKSMPSDYQLRPSVAIDPPSVPAALLNLGSEARLRARARVEAEAKSSYDAGPPIKQTAEPLEKSTNTETRSTLRDDDGNRPLRELLPPDGTEKDNFSLNNSFSRHDDLLGRKLLARGKHNDYEEYPAHDDDRPASSVRRDSEAGKTNGDRGGWSATRQRREHNPTIGRHEHNTVSGGDRQE
jgi:Rod binding domain-containing protein